MSDTLFEKLPEKACVINYEDMIANPRSALGTLVYSADLQRQKARCPLWVTTGTVPCHITIL